MTENERRVIVESGPVFLANGLRAQLGGWASSPYCSVHSARPGWWACSWDTAAAVCARPDRRFTSLDCIWKTGDGWLGLTPDWSDFQTPEDYDRWTARQEQLRV